MYLRACGAAFHRVLPSPAPLVRGLPVTRIVFLICGMDKKSEKAMKESLPVLVVEDEEPILSILKTAVERGGVKVVGAASGGEALVLLEQGEFSAIISDLRMPGGIGGAEIFDWVERNRPELISRFLFITGNVHDPFALETRQRTGAVFIEKPFRLAHLIELIKKIIVSGEAAHV
jgi:DNA-binding NtrC family response regulator